MTLGMKTKYLIPNIALITAGMMIASIVSYIVINNTLTQTFVEKMEDRANLSVNLMKLWIADKESDIRGLSQRRLYLTVVKDSYMGRNARKSANLELAKLLQSYPFYENICVSDKQGNLVASSDTSIIGKINLSEYNFLKKTFAGKNVVSKPVISPVSQKPIFIISSPIIEKNETTGVLFCAVKLSFFNNAFIDSIKPGKSGYAIMYDKNGMIIAHPDKSQILKLNIKDTEFKFIELKNNKRSLTYRHNNNDYMIALKQYDELGWTVLINAFSSEILEPFKNVRNINFAINSSVVLLVSFVILYLVNKTIKPISNIALGLNGSSDLIYNASGQLNSSSQTLTQNASNQAVSIEETSSSIEEIAAMTNQNAENAILADQLMKKTTQIVQKADNSIHQLAASIKEISQSSQETSKIIKTIDEIAFQTNLLALNAAVEAARAGETGAGFAVVASEVRNLAMRAAEAAKTTSFLIEETVNKISAGETFAQISNEVFNEVASSAVKVGELVSEIAAASNEQAQGIKQINKAVADIEKTIQNNASYTQQTSAVSDELYSQANNLKNFVAKLSNLINGNKAAS